jgi:hypothetical protein
MKKGGPGMADDSVALQALRVGVDRLPVVSQPEKRD